MLDYALSAAGHHNFRCFTINCPHAVRMIVGPNFDLGSAKVRIESFLWEQCIASNVCVKSMSV